MEGIAKHGPCIVWVSSTRIMNYHLTPAATPLKTSPSLNFHSGFVMHTRWTEEVMCRTPRTTALFKKRSGTPDTSHFYHLHFGFNGAPLQQTIPATCL